MTLTAIPVVSAAAATRVIEAWLDELDLQEQWGWRWQYCLAKVLRYQFGEHPATSDVIYFAHAASSPIKVGWSAEPVKRIAALSSAVPYAPIVLVENQLRSDEQRLHALLGRFSKRRRPGVCEWYHPNSPVMSLAYRLANAAEWCLAERYREPRIRKLRRSAA